MTESSGMVRKPRGDTWRIGVAGLGTVGAGLLTFLAERPTFAPAGCKAVVTGVSALPAPAVRHFQPALV
jgi:homoserine dehydrogenase